MTPAPEAEDDALDLSTPRAFVPLLEPARYKGAHGGRGSGKSHFFAEMLIERAILQEGLRAVCIREIQKSLEQSVKRLLEDKIQAMGVGAWFRVLNNEIHTPGDGLIIFQGMQNHTAESIKSLEGYDIAWVEEAQSLSQRSLDLLRPTIRKPGSEIWFTWNPNKATDPVDKLLRGPDGAPPGSVVIQANYRDNPFFPDVLRAEMEFDRRRDLEKFGHIWLGGYQTLSEARVFKNWRVDEFETPADARFHFGADWGFSIDPTVLVRCFISGRTLYVDREVYAIGCEIDRTPFLFAGTADPEVNNLNAQALAALPPPLRQEWKGIEGSRRWPIIADSARPETINYMLRHGFGNITPAIKGAGSVEEGVTFLQSHDVVVHPRCRHTIDELTHYSYKTDKLTGEVLPVLEDRKNHVIDALRYAVETLRRSTYDASMAWVG
ncbi:PBSX family phage terminase large subunit [Inquilinus sp.]|uniref:PBSX family phage terminase large subunit n=1 Tax=Inquilinus sp. TaxID=1932117 RepID=UPI0031E0E110